MKKDLRIEWFGLWGVTEDDEYDVWLVGSMSDGVFIVEWDFLTRDQAVSRARECQERGVTP